MVLNTARLTLRDPDHTDYRPLSLYQKDPRYLEYYNTVPDSKSIIDSAIKWTKEVPRRNYQLIVESASGVIGCVGLRTEQCALGEAEIGIEFNPDHWGNGFAREALNALIKFAHSIDVHTLRAETNRNNLRAIKLMESESFERQDEIGDELTMRLKI